MPIGPGVTEIRIFEILFIRDRMRKPQNFKMPQLGNQLADRAEILDFYMSQ